MGAVFIFVAALLPMWMWVTGRVIGFPLFPLYALPHFWAFGLPLIYEHPIVNLFPPSLQLKGAITVSAYLFVATFVWIRASQHRPRPPSRQMMLEPERADLLFLGCLAGGIFFLVESAYDLVPMPGGVYAIVRAAALAAEAIAAFVLSFRWGEGSLGGVKRSLFALLFLSLILVSLHDLIMVSMMSLTAIALLGYALGARRLPWIPVTLAICTFGFLHLGKSEIRERYWSEETDTVPGGDYLSVLAEWSGIALDRLTNGTPEEEEETQSLTERASLMHLFLYIQTVTPTGIPYLYGDTYAVIPGILVPRVLNSEKVRSHEGTYILSVHYGIQSESGTQRTTIGFGLLNEAYANFGYLGLALLALFTGTFYGVVGRWSGQAPVLSMRFLFGIIVASYAFQDEFSASVLVAALFQSTVVLLALSLVFMHSSEASIVPDQPRLSPAGGG